MAFRPDGLTDKQFAFVQEYLVDLNGRQAAIRAGYSEHTANEIASENLAKLNIQEAIAVEQAKRSQRLEITADRVLMEIAKVGFASMGNYLSTTAAGECYIDMSGVTPDQLAAISEYQIDDYTDGRGEDAREIKRTKLKLHGKLEALKQLGVYLGWYKQRTEITGANGGPIQFKTDAERAEAVTAILDAARARATGSDPSEPS